MESDDAQGDANGKDPITFFDRPTSASPKACIRICSGTVKVLHNLANDDSLLPYHLLETNVKAIQADAENNDALLHAIKMYCAIAKSSTREAYNAITKSKASILHSKTIDFLNDVPKVLSKFRKLKDLLDEKTDQQILQAFRYGDEFLSNILEKFGYRLRRDQLAKASPYPLNGINDNIRFNITEFLRKMDSPNIPLQASWEDTNYSIIIGNKVYYIHFVIQCSFEGQTENRHILLACNRDGIVEVKEL